MIGKQQPAYSRSGAVACVYHAVVVCSTFISGDVMQHWVLAGMHVHTTNAHAEVCCRTVPPCLHVHACSQSLFAHCARICPLLTSCPL